MQLIFICSTGYLGHLVKESHSSVLLQDIIGDDEIKLDWFFKASLTHDLVNVSVTFSVLLVSYIYSLLTDVARPALLTIIYTLDVVPIQCDMKKNHFIGLKFEVLSVKKIPPCHT